MGSPRVLSQIQIIMSKSKSTFGIIFQQLELKNLYLINSSHRINETAAAALSGSGKAQPSSSSQKSTWAESSKVHKLDHSSGGVRSFTGGHSAQHAQQAEDEFSSFLDGVDPVTSVP